MPLGIKPSDIADDDLRRLMERANAALDGGENVECVRACANAYLTVLSAHPVVLEGLKAVLETERVKVGLERGTIRNAPLMWPRYGAKLQFQEGEPAIVFDRKHMALGETIQYYEFTLDLIVQAEQGKLRLGPSGGGLG